MYSSLGPPGIPPDAPERSHNAGCNEMPVVRRNIGEQVQTNRKLNVARIEIHQMIGSMRRNVMKKFLG